MPGLQVKVHFNADEALAELQRLGQLQESSDTSHQGTPDDLQDAKHSAVPFSDGYAKLKGHWNDLLLRPDEAVGSAAAGAV